MISPRVVRFNTGIVVASSAVATCGPKAHGVAPAGTRGDACGSQAAIPSDSAEKLCVTAAHGLSVTSIGMWQSFTWT